MTQIVFTICFGALAGWFIAALAQTKKKNTAVLAHILFGIIGGLVALGLVEICINTTVAGGKLYAVILSIAGSLVAISIGRNYSIKK